MLRGLQRNVDTRFRAELASPHPGCVDHDLGLDPASVGLNTRDATLVHVDVSHHHTLDDANAELSRTLRKRGRNTHRIGATLIRNVERPEHIRRVEQGPHIPQLTGGKLDFGHAEAVHPCRGAAQRLQPSGIAGKRHVSDRAESGRMSGLRLESLIEIA